MCRLTDSGRAVWKFTELSQHSENHGVGSLRARLEVTNGPSNQGTIAAQFNCEGTTLSGVEFDLTGSGYRLSLVKRRFVSGICFIFSHSFSCVVEGYGINCSSFRFIFLQINCSRP